MSREDLVKNHSLLIEAMEHQGLAYLPPQAALPNPYRLSVSPLRGLKQVYLKDLWPNTQHVGVYVLLRAITQPLRRSTVISVMEDEFGDTVKLQLYKLDEDNQQAASVIPEGKVCIIKEPWCRIMAGGGYGIQVDHISDILWLSKADERMPAKWRSRSRNMDLTATEMKENGNDALKMGKTHEAIEWYDAALQVEATPEEARIIRVNRSLANLRIGYLDKALDDAGDFSVEAVNTEKGLYRAARSLYELGRVRESHNVFRSLLKVYPSNEAARKELRRTEDRLREQDHGLYDFLAMHKAAVERAPPCLDVANFTGPVTIKMTEGRGRGMFTTRDMTAGELLLCEKAFSYSFFDSSSSSMLSARTLKGTPGDLVTKAVHQLHRTPLISTMTSLYHDGYESVNEKEADGMPIVDTFLLNRIISLNAFESPRVCILENVSKIGLPIAEQQRPDHACGLYIKASHVNHSCYSNVRPSFIGDILILRATRNVAAGQELCFSYAVPKADHSYEKMKENLQNWGFDCRCEICIQDQETLNETKDRRTALLKEWELAAKNVIGEAGLANMERLLAAIEQTYPVAAATAPRLALWDPCLALTRVYASMDDPMRTITTAWKVLAALGFVVERDTSSVASPFQVKQWGLMVHPLIETWVHLWMAYECLLPRRPELCKKAEDYAKTTYKICIGEDETFEDKLGGEVKKAIHKMTDPGTASMTL